MFYATYNVRRTSNSETINYSPFGKINPKFQLSIYFYLKYFYLNLFGFYCDFIFTSLEFEIYLLLSTKSRF